MVLWFCIGIDMSWVGFLLKCWSVLKMVLLLLSCCSRLGGVGRCVLVRLVLCVRIFLWVLMICMKWFSWV